MRFTALLFFGALIVPISHAEEDWRTGCKNAQDIAESIMKGRQQGVAMSKMMEVAEGDAANILEALIIEAYDRPRYSTEKMQQRSVQGFRDDVYLECVKARRN